jgi:hypothetical protein
LQRMVSGGVAATRKLTHARVLLHADQSTDGPGWTDVRIGEALGLTTRTIEHVRRRFVEEGLEATLVPRKRAVPPVERKLDGVGEAKLVALCCSKPPEGRRRWTLRLLEPQPASVPLGVRA